MILRFLYRTIIGRLFLKLLTWPALSVAVGHFLDTGFSCFLIKPFIKHKNIDLSICDDTEFDSFNAFFCRKVNEKYRPICQDKDFIISPCDGLLSIYHIDNDLVIPVKQSRYHISDLLRNEALANEFNDGLCLVFRLCVNHYHRYTYIESGQKSNNTKIHGVLHTVQPIALRDVPVFTENSREYTLIETDDIGKIVQMEVGAMLVGKIDNYEEECKCIRGEEKGRFLYGGSTIIVLLQKDCVVMPDDIMDATNNSIETPVIMGQKLLTKR